MHSPPAPWHLIWAVGLQKTASRLVLTPGEWVLGTDPGCSVVLEGQSVAQRHVRLTLRENDLDVELLAEGRTLLVNGVSVEGSKRAFAPVDLRVGDVSLTLTLDPSVSEEGPMTLSNGSSTVQRGDFPREQTCLLVTEAPGTVAEAAPDLDFPTVAIQITPGEAWAMDQRVSVQVMYGLRQELARGGMGKIYVGQDHLLEREVAVKVATVDGLAGAEAFDREARILARLAHPNIVPVYSMGTDSNGRPFYAMKLVRGITLYTVLRKLREGDLQFQKDYRLDKLLRIFRRVCDAMAFAHSRRFLHRDLKPGNVMIGEFGEVLVMDWGLAMRMRAKEQQEEGDSEKKPEGGARIIEGTPQYMSPEQAMGQVDELDERSDVYALGAVLYSILTFRPPVEGKDVEEILSKVVRGMKTTVSTVMGPAAFSGPVPMDRRVPEALRAVTMKAMALKKEERYQRVEDLEADIEAYLAGFATQAEAAGFFRMVWLLIKRNKRVAALLLISFLGASLSAVRLARSERVARQNEVLAQEAAQDALQKAREAKDAARLAADNERKAREEKKIAEHEREESRKAQAKAQIALTETAYKNLNAAEMRRALELVPEYLRDQEWRYLWRTMDSQSLTVEVLDDSPWIGMYCSKTHSPPLAYTLQANGWVRWVDLTTGQQKQIVQIPSQNLLPAFAVVTRPNFSGLAVMREEPSEGKAHRLARLEVYNFKGALVANSDGALPYGEGGVRLDFDDKGELLFYFSRHAKDAHRMRGFNVQTGKWIWGAPETALAECFVTGESIEVIASSPKQGQPYVLSSGSGVLTPGTLTGTSVLRFDQSKSADGYVARYPARGKAEFFFGLLKGRCSRLSLAEGRVTLFALYRDLAETHALATLHSPSILAAFSTVGDDGAWMGLFDVQGERLADIPILLEGEGRESWRIAAHPVSSQLLVMRSKQMKVWSLLEPRAVRRYGGSTGDSQCMSQLDPWGSFAYWKADRKLFKVHGSPSDRGGTDFMEAPGTLSQKCVVSRDGRTLLLLQALADSTLSFIRLESEQGQWIQKAQGTAPVPLSDWTTSFQLNPSSGLLWTGARFLDAKSGHVLIDSKRPGLDAPLSGKSSEWIGNDRVAEVVLLTPQQKFIPVGRPTRALVVWSPKSADPQKVMVAENAVSVSASPDGKFLAEAGLDGRVRIRDAVSLKEERAFRFSMRPLKDVSWHPTLPLLAVFGDDLHLTLWNPQNGEMAADLGLILAGGNEVEWSVDGTLVGIKRYGKELLAEEFYAVPKTVPGMPQ